MAMDYIGDMSYYQNQLDKAGIDMDICNYAGCTARELQSIVDNEIHKHSKRIRFTFSKQQMPSYNDKECFFPLENGEVLVLSKRDCIEVFQTVADELQPELDRDKIANTMLKACGLGEI